MLGRLQAVVDWVYWHTLLWYHRAQCVRWAVVIWWYSGELPKEIWPKKKK